MSTIEPGRWPLLPAQSGVWLADALSSGHASSIISDRIDLFGPLDRTALAAAHRQVEQEAEALRLRFRATPDGPVQYVDPAASTPLRFVDVSAEADPQRAAADWMAADTDAPVDVFGPALCTTALLRLGPRHHVLYRRVHHLVVDGWSLARLHRRTAELYTAFASSPATAPAEVGRPFPPYRVLVDADAAYRAGPRHEQDRLFWADRLRDLPEPVRLAGRRYARSGRVLRRRADLSADLLARLRTAAARLGVGWSDLAVGLVTAYVARLTGADDVVVGMPVTARLSRAEQAAPGMTTNGMPLRLRPTAGATLGEFLASVALDLREALLHSRYPTTGMIADLGLTGTGRALWGPIVNVMGSETALDFAGLRAELRTLSTPDIEDFSAIFFHRPGGAVELILDVDAGGYSTGELEAHLRRLIFFLDGAANADPGTPLVDLPLVDEAELRHLRTLGTGPSRDIPDIGVHQMVEEWADRTPDAPALDYGDSVWTYRALEERANRLARLLVARGAGPGRTVGLALPRCPDLIVSALAVLKTGAAFLSLDTTAPAARIALMVADAAPVVLLLRTETADVPAGTAERLVLDDPETGAALAAVSPGRLTDADRRAPLVPASPAYLIYTSGSTGTPKAVMVAHRGVVNVTQAMVDRLGPGPGRRTLQFASPSFDAFVGEMTQSIFLGGTLVGVPQDQLVPGPGLAELLHERRVNDLVLVPSVLAQLSPAELPPGATVSIVGEAAAPTVVERFAPVCRLINGYGPTEGTISTAMSPPLTPADATAPPIGTPLRNLHVHVLDERLRPVPTGAVGELYIGGAGVALGYLNQPELTGRRFLPDPFAGPGARMYRSGDLVRWNADGQLLFVGRDDGQTKVNGFRIELGEVEAALVRLPGVARAAATVHEDPTGDRRLLGYVVPAPGARVDPRELRRALGTQLPSHLVPQLLGVLDDLPLTRSGKLDRRALPDLRGESMPTRRSPSGPVQEAVALAFGEVLQIPTVAPQDSFFELGGHSLSATRLVGRLRRRFGVKLDVRALFANLTVTAVADEIAAVVGADWGRGPLVPLRPAGGAEPLFCVAAPGTDPWIHLRLAPHLPDRPLYGLATPLPVTDDEVGAHVERIRASGLPGPYHLVGVGDGAGLARRLAAALSAAGAPAGRVVLVPEKDLGEPAYDDDTVVVTGPELGSASADVFDPEPVARLGAILQSVLDDLTATAADAPRVGAVSGREWRADENHR
ncbi:amino acid adenylation domain-containing protein [Micromonospora sp. R77]|uniref:amino acid adenylation domain-containing protein n=1 Tax=Micromonospora sp. R77 TaxID=2925836 RepID=UPI001F6176E5|nr:amino acid adenylation domain-containing protein [Micromonospora sp. R77]MCI4066855.1 amino acid adenylation domain-containing protein [Micromonospora sp. R77]